MPSDNDPQIEGDRRVLGIVPGRPPVGDRKEPQEEQVFMTSPHLLVRHAVVAVAVLLLVLLISIFFDAPLLE
ncbi:MAG: hypothetical protein ACC658_09600, partial [Acidimicrobiia bacterium]